MLIDGTDEAITSTQMEKYSTGNGMQDIKTEPDKSSSLMEIYWKALGSMANEMDNSLLPILMEKSTRVNFGLENGKADGPGYKLLFLDSYHMFSILQRENAEKKGDKKIN